LCEQVVKVLSPAAGNWTVVVGSAGEHSVRVAGLSNLTFHYGFSVSPPAQMKETSYRPLKSTPFIFIIDPYSLHIVYFHRVHHIMCLPYSLDLAVL
jgi:hypothetical protein